jgi:hypothetical protein
MSVLVIVLDVNPDGWLCDSQSSEEKSLLRKPSLPEVTQAMLGFINAYHLLDYSNRVVVIGAGPQTTFVYPREGEQEMFDRRLLATTIASRVAEMVDAAANNAHEGAGQQQGGSQLAGALSLGLCYINRYKSKKAGAGARVLLLNANNDIPVQYKAIMNCIFSASKQVNEGCGWKCGACRVRG